MVGRTVIDHLDTKDTKDLSSSKGFFSVSSVWYHNKSSLYFYHGDVVTKLLLPDLNRFTFLFEQPKQITIIEIKCFIQTNCLLIT